MIKTLRRQYNGENSPFLATLVALTPGYFDLPAGSSAGRGAALAAGAVAAVRAVFDLRRS